MSKDTPGDRSHFILGMRLDYLSSSVAADRIIELAGSGHPGYCAISNVHQCVLTHDDSAFRNIINGADLVISDSTILNWARALRHRVPALPTMRGADLFYELARRAAERGIPVGLYGGRDPETLAAAWTELLRRFPALRIVYADTPPFRPPNAEEDAATVAAIRKSGAQLLLVGLGCPKQERWMAAHTGRLGATAVGLGAAFDYGAGRLRPPPGWMHAVGLEWLGRLVSEPRRLLRRYLTTSPRFLLLLAVDLVRGSSP